MQAAEKLKITATELCKLKIADGIIPVICSLSKVFFEFTFTITLMALELNCF